MIDKKTNDNVCPKCGNEEYIMGQSGKATWSDEVHYFMCDNCGYIIEKIDHEEIKPKELN